ncbi:hypothetical protein SAMN04489752_3444 [Brevibacterium siliguriense]|uniref:Uncharacterized protein n=1 Tax=Brevibacterium siliguriense TaxID=1136497 RepID=A0A1H1XUW6_9MICO|nr:hypothetical protein [Brevibacterium siliguriense]SDT13027.1 hypothetical protein SAMN04489752_3444 [Brevibacterium siliguriense]
MKDQIDVSVRRSPKYSVFMGIGAVLGIVLAGVLAVFVDPADMPMGYTVAKGMGLMLLVLGIGGLFLGGLIALILDWRGRKTSKEYRVDAQIDMVDDPKEIARRRIAESRGEDPDAGETEDGAASAGQDAIPEIDESAPAVDEPEPAVDDAGDAGTGRDSAPGSTV